MDRNTFCSNLVEASETEDGFAFLDSAGCLSPPKRMSTAAKSAITVGVTTGLMVAAPLLGLRVLRPPSFSTGNHDPKALAAELRALGNICEIAGVRIRTGEIILRLCIVADRLSLETLIGRFAIIHERASAFRRYSDGFAGTMQIIAQGVILFSVHANAKHFVENFAGKCQYRSGTARGVSVYTQAWVIDLEDEIITRCAGLWQLGNRAPLNSKKLLGRLFSKQATSSY